MRNNSLYGIPWWRLVDYELSPYPLRSMCRDLYRGMYCIGGASLISYHGCNIGTIVTAGPNPPVGGQPTDSAPVPNEGVVRGGLFAPTPVPVPVGAGDPAPPVERLAGRFDQVRSADDLDNITSIPARATRKMKEEDARREGSRAEGSGAARGSFDRAEGSAKPDKGSTADAGTRLQPPPREPTKVKGNSDTNRDTRSKGGYGSPTRTSSPSNGPDRVNRPVETKSTGTSPGSTVNPPSIQGAATTEKKKPPTDE